MSSTCLLLFSLVYFMWLQNQKLDAVFKGNCCLSILKVLLDCTLCCCAWLGLKRKPMMYVVLLWQMLHFSCYHILLLRWLGHHTWQWWIIYSRSTAIYPVVPSAIKIMFCLSSFLPLLFSETIFEDIEAVRNGRSPLGQGFSGVFKFCWTTELKVKCSWHLMGKTITKVEWKIQT